jgi:hypothetical protein
MVDAKASQKKRQQHAHHFIAANRFVLHLKNCLRVRINHCAHGIFSSSMDTREPPRKFIPKPAQPQSMLKKRHPEDAREAGSL